MASVKATFSLDEETDLMLTRTAARLGRPRSAVIREAVLEYIKRHEYAAAERRRMLAVFDDLVPRIPARPGADVDAELAELRRSRRRGGRNLPGVELFTP